MDGSSILDVTAPDLNGWRLQPERALGKWIVLALPRKGGPMVETFESYFERIRACEAAIIRIRSAMRAGEGSSDAVATDFMLIRSTVLQRLRYRARHTAWLGPEAEQEALETMQDQLLDDILGGSYLSLEQKFGAYLKTMPTHVLRKIERTYTSSLESRMERIDGEGIVKLSAELDRNPLY